MPEQSGIVEHYSIIYLSLFKSKPTLNEVKVYAAISYFQGRNEWAFPSLKTIGDLVDIKDTSDISQAITRLVKKGLVIRKRQFGRSSLYSIVAKFKPVSEIKKENKEIKKKGRGKPSLGGNIPDAILDKPNDSLGGNILDSLGGNILDSLGGNILFNKKNTIEEYHNKSVCAIKDQIDLHEGSPHNGLMSTNTPSSDSKEEKEISVYNSTAVVAEKAEPALIVYYEELKKLGIDYPVKGGDVHPEKCIEYLKIITSIFPPLKGYKPDAMSLFKDKQKIMEYSHILAESGKYNLYERITNQELLSLEQIAERILKLEKIQEILFSEKMNSNIKYNQEYYAYWLGGHMKRNLQTVMNTNNYASIVPIYNRLKGK
jgi:DNA-binding MarR family transcriptional regulator